MSTCLRKQRNKTKAAACFLAAGFFLLCIAVPVLADETTPIYSFDYQGRHIDTYATYSEVDGVKTDGFRYFVKDGNLIIVDNRLNTVPDGTFIHYEDGDSYIGVLTRGGRLVSLGTVNLPAKLENFKNSGISDIVSNVDGDSRELIISYENGGMVGYDVVTGKELFRRGGTEGEVSLTDYISQYLDNMVKKDSSTVKSEAKIEAEEIAAIMNEKGYTLEELVDGGVFTDTEALNEFVESGDLESGARGNSPGGGTGESNAVTQKTTDETGQEAADGGTDSKNANTAASAAQKETKAADAGEKETKENETKEGGSGTEADSDSVIKGSSLIGKETTSSEGKAADGKGGKEGLGKEGETKAGKEASGKEGKEAAENSDGKETTKVDKEDGETENSRKKTEDKAADAGTAGGSGGVNTEGSWNGEGTEKGSGTYYGPEGNGGSGTPGDQSQSVPAGSAASETEAGAVSGGSGEKAGDSKDAANASGEKDGEDKTESSEDTEAEKSEKSEKKNVMKNSGSSQYVTVYNPETGSYEIYAVSELMDNPGDPKSENEKLGNAENRQIASLLKVKEDENNERGFSLYAVIILAVAALMGLAVLFMQKKNRQEEQSERQKEEEKQRIADMKKKQQEAEV